MERAGVKLSLSIISIRRELRKSRAKKDIFEMGKSATLFLWEHFPSKAED